MKLWSVLISCTVLCLSASACLAEEAAEEVPPQLTGFAVAPGVVSQGRPVRLTFSVTNQTDENVYSQRPYAGAAYNLYQTFTGRGFRALPDRYMVGVSLDGGRDGYPYRWGFRGLLQPGRTTTVAGFLALVEAGTYELTAALLHGGAPLDEAARTVTVRVQVIPQAKLTGRPVPGAPIYPVINGRRFPPTVPYVVDGHLLVAVRPVIHAIAPNVFFVEQTIVIRQPGLEIVLFPGTHRALVNGVPMLLPAPVHIFDGRAYVPVRFISPLLGATFYYYPYSRGLFIDVPTVVQ